MNCPNCQRPNPDDARFCMACGTALKQACASCGTELPGDARFCYKCGHRVGAPVAAPTAAPKAESAKPPPGPQRQGERRVITVLFCDVVRSTSLAERMDPEDWTEIMNQAFQHLTSAVQRYEGTIARLMGDALLAFFGAPVAHEDDPERAVLAGLDIIEGIRPLQAQLKAERGIDFQVRVGINTGPVVVGDVGSALAAEYTAMGDAVNVAARMEQTAQPGTVRVAADTHRLVAPLFEWETLGPIEVRGKAEPVQAYRPLRVMPQQARFLAAQAITAPLIGRQAEMEKLRRLIAGFKSGTGGVAFIIGEAGLGKSRLLEELRKEWVAQGDSSAWMESRGVSYDRTRPYSLFRRRFQEIFDVKEGDPPEVIRQKVASRMGSHFSEHDLTVCSALVHLMCTSKTVPGGPADPEEVQRDLFNRMPAMWEMRASVGPMLMVFDDVQWADQASIDLILKLLPISLNRRVLVLCACRPDPQSPAWRLRDAAARIYGDKFVEIVLRPLRESETLDLVSRLMPGGGLPAGLQQTIVRKAEGNPLFIEEIVRALVERGMVESTAAGLRLRAGVEAAEALVPNSLQAMLTARIDRLDQQARETLQLASVIGRTFPYRVLERISDAATSLDRHLFALLRADLLEEASRHPELELLFKHELARDAAYNSILHRRRRDLHRRVAEALEAVYPDRLEDLANRLAYHYGQAGDDAKAAQYGAMAGNAAAALYANQEAIVHYSQAVEAAARVNAPPEQMAYLYKARARVLEATGQTAAAQKDQEALAKLS